MGNKFIQLRLLLYAHPDREFLQADLESRRPLLSGMNFALLAIADSDHVLDTHH
ncbi:MAG: hypothetical protein JO068_19595, partial [Hyphomicrobiales bacterium]|nr:hypothetical protein [Hyphomicrobiales bacterium]